MNLKTKANSSFFWSFMIQGGLQGVNFAVSIILARLLLPEDFGLIGMVAVFIGISSALVNGGFVSSLIRTKNATNQDYTTVFITNLITSIFIYILLFFGAPLIAKFYNEDILVLIVRVLSINLIINALSLVQSTKINKELNFRLQFKLQIPSLLASALISVWLAFNGFGVWSLVVKELVFSIMTTILLWYNSTWYPSFQFNKEKFFYHFNFGYKLSLTQVIDILFQNFYKILIGKFFSAAQLGFYTRAKSLEELPTGFFYNAFNRAAYPLLSNINIDDNNRLRLIYSKLLMMIVFLVTPILLYLFVVAEPLIIWMLTEKWIEIIPYFKILVLSGIFFPIHKYNLNICNLKGKSDIVLKLSMLQNLLLLIGGLSAIWFGVIGLIYSVLIINITITIINSHISGKLIDYSLKSQVKDLLPVFILNFSTFLICLFFYYFMSTSLNLNYISLIIISVVVFFLFYFSFAKFFKVIPYLEIVNVVNSFFKS